MKTLSGLLVALAVVAIDCKGNPNHGVADELVPKSKPSWTSKMALMVSISEDATLATKVTADGKFVLADLSIRKVVWQRDVSGRCVESVAIDPSGKFLAYPLECKEVVVEEIATGKSAEYQSPGGNRGIHSVAMGEGGYPLAFGACGRGVYVVRTAGAVPATFHALGPCENVEDDAVQSLALSKGSRLLAAGWGYWSQRRKTSAEDRKRVGWADPGIGDGVGVSIWSLQDGMLRAELPGALAASTASFSPSSEVLVGLGDSNRGTSWLWDTVSGARVRILEESLYNPNFLKDGTLLTGLLPTVNAPHAHVYVLSVDTGKAVIGVDAQSQDIMTRGHYAAGRSDKFLVAHRTGQVDVYRVSQDGRSAEQVWSF